MRKPLQTISAREFAGRFASGVRVSQQSFTWFLGAGCSKTSGILDAAGLVEKWLREQYELEANPAKAFNTWLKSNFASYDSENPAKHYAQAFARRHPSPVERQREIEIICARGEPAYGYATLAQLLSNKDYGRYCNTVLTTNFDDLIADALYLYGERHSRPLVVTHEALARYVRTNSPRPIIVKLHGDAHVDPKNLQPETRELDVALCKQLYPFLQDHALIFIGYGGNDESILKFVQNCPVPALAPPIFWVSKREAPAPFQDWLSERDALRVDLTDFDQLMHLIRNALGIELIDRRRWNQIGDTYYESFERLKKEIDKLTGTSDDTNALKLATTSAQRSLPDDWTLFSAAKELEVKSPDEADRIYREGLEKFPNSRALNNNYALFLRNVRQNMDAAEIQYKRALDVDPSNSFSLTSYAAFLQDVRKDFDAAEKHYKRAIEADPNDAYSLVRYAAFLNSVRNDTSAAELYYKRAVEAEPTYAFGLENYARFLERIRQDMDGAETYYKRAIEAAPADDYALESYALFLQNIRKNMDAAEVFHKRAVEADPTSPYALENYALFLQKIRKNMDAAEIFHKRAVEADPDSAYILGNYAYFLDHVRNEGDAAAIYYERANKADEP